MACIMGQGNGPFNSFMERFDLARAECTPLQKYNSVGCQYWRDKLHSMQNGLAPRSEMPTKAYGAQQLDRDVEDGWLLLDEAAAKNPMNEHHETEDDFIDLTTSQSARSGGQSSSSGKKGKKSKKSSRGSGIFGFGLVKQVKKVHNFLSANWVKDQLREHEAQVKETKKIDSNIHDKAKAELEGSSSSDEEESKSAPFMLQVHMPSSENKNENSDEDDEDNLEKMRGSTKVAFFRKNMKNQPEVVRDYRQQEKDEAYHSDGSQQLGKDDMSSDEQEEEEEVKYHQRYSYPESPTAASSGGKRNDGDNPQE